MGDYAITIKLICKNKGITLAELAERLCIQYQSLSKAINQDYPQLQTLERIATELDCSLVDIIGGDGTTIQCPHCGKRIKIAKGE